MNIYGVQREIKENKIIHSERHEFKILADENSQLNFWNWRVCSKIVPCVQSWEVETFSKPPGDGVCRMYFKARFPFSVAKSVSKADSKLARIMSDFVKILSL